MLEIVANVLYHLLLCCCRKTRHGDVGVASFALLVFLDKLAYIEIVDTEILSPGREAVCLVDDESHHMARHQYLLYGLRPQHLGRYV